MAEKPKKPAQSSQPKKGERSKTEIQALESMLKKKTEKTKPDTGAKDEHTRDEESE